MLRKMLVGLQWHFETLLDFLAIKSSIVFEEMKMRNLAIPNKNKNL